MQSFTKKVLEFYPITVEFREKLPPNSALSAGTASAVDVADGSDQTAAVLQSPTAVINGTRAIFSVQGGTALHQYQITLLANLGGGGTLQEDLLMIIED